MKKISGTNFDNASDFMIVMRPKLIRFRFDHCLNIDLILFIISTELKSHKS